MIFQIKLACNSAIKSFYRGWKRPLKAYCHLSQASTDWSWDSQWLRYWSSQQGSKQHGKHPSFTSNVSLQEQCEVDCKHMEPSIIHCDFLYVIFILRSCYYCGTAEYYPIPNSFSGIGLHHLAWPRTRGSRTIFFHGSSLIKLDPWVSQAVGSLQVWFSITHTWLLKWSQSGWKISSLKWRNAWLDCPLLTQA